MEFLRKYLWSSSRVTPFWEVREWYIEEIALQNMIVFFLFSPVIFLRVSNRDSIGVYGVLIYDKAYY